MKVEGQSARVAVRRGQGSRKTLGRPTAYGMSYDYEPCARTGAARTPSPDLGGIEAVEPQVRLNHAERKSRT